ncbi:MAG: DUF6502 family protein [Rhodospirillaceae bacterium]
MSTGSNASSPMKQPSAALVRAVTRLLGPLVRLLIARGITFSYLSGLLKTVYVAEAQKSLAAAGEVPTVSRLSIVTGLQRKDINRIRSEPPPELRPPAAVSLGARLIGIWTGERKFRTAKGGPAPLPRAAKSGTASFDALVRSVSTDVSPRVVLDEWLRLGLVAIDANEHIRLNAGAFVPQRGFDEKVYFLGRNVGDHIATVVHNALGEGEPHLERAVYSDKLTADSVQKLQSRAAELGMKTLLALNKEALKLADADEGKKNATYRMALGVYYYQGPDEPPSDDPDTAE